MELREFSEIINEYIKKVKKEEVIEFVNNLIRKIPKSKYEEVLCMVNNGRDSYLNDIDIKSKIDEYKEKFNQMEQGDLYFQADEYEDYSYGWDNWTIEYYDSYNLGSIINNAVDYAIELLNCKKYDYAKEIFDIVLSTNYQALNEDFGETLGLELVDMKVYDLINFDVQKLCLYSIYTTYQVSNNKVKDIYSYFKYNYNFLNISIEDSFKLGVEKLIGLDEFYVEWIDFLSEVKGKVEQRLLKEAFTYTNYLGYEKYIGKITKYHPEIIIDIFNNLREKNKIEELIKLGNKTLKAVDSSLKIGSDIAIYLADIDKKNKEEYICKAFAFDKSIINLLRIINDGYYEKHKSDIEKQIIYSDDSEKQNTNTVDKKTYYLLQFFMGNFETFLNESVKHKKTLGWTNSFEGTAVYLWLLYLNESNGETKSYQKALSYISFDIGYNEKDSKLLGNNMYEIWNRWKNEFEI